MIITWMQTSIEFHLPHYEIPNCHQSNVLYLHCSSKLQGDIHSWCNLLWGKCSNKIVDLRVFSMQNWEKVKILENWSDVIYGWPHNMLLLVSWKWKTVKLQRVGGQIMLEEFHFKHWNDYFDFIYYLLLIRKSMAYSLFRHKKEIF